MWQRLKRFTIYLHNLSKNILSKYPMNDVMWPTIFLLGSNVWWNNCDENVDRITNTVLYFSRYKKYKALYHLYVEGNKQTSNYYLVFIYCGNTPYINICLERFFTCQFKTDSNEVSIMCIWDKIAQVYFRFACDYIKKPLIHSTKYRNVLVTIQVRVNILLRIRLSFISIFY